MQGGLGGLSELSEQSAQAVSALMDGELDGDAAAREIGRLKADAASRGAWDTYHVIGDAMRGATVRSRKDAPDFGLRFGEKLALEPTVLAPQLQPGQPGQTHQPASRFSRSLQTYALSAAASVAAVAVVGWVAFNTLRPDGAAVGQVAALAPVTQAQSPLQAASVNPPVIPAAVPVEPPVEPPVEHIHHYMLAHQGISPTTVFQGVAPYIRTVSSADE